MKTCFKCKQQKPSSQFYKHTAMADGRMGKCKECAKEDANLNRRRRIDYYRAYDRRRGNRQAPGSTKRRPAHSKVAKAIKRCALVKLPCQMCGSAKQVHAHHDDYTKPLDVMWLCPEHHKARHAFLDYINDTR